MLFHALDRGQLRRITELMLDRDRGPAGRAGHHAAGVSDAALDWLAEHGHQPELGARPLRRTIARELDRTLSRLIIAGELGSGQRVELDVADGELTVTPGKKL